MSDIDQYKQLLMALVPYQRDLRKGTNWPTGNLRLPSDPKRALGDVKAVQGMILAERELQK